MLAKANTRGVNVTYTVNVKGGRHVRIQPDCITRALAELLAARGGQQWYCEAHRRELLFDPANVVQPSFVLGVCARLRNMFDSVHAGNNVSVLIATADLYLHAMFPVHVPPIPGLKQGVRKFREGHTVALLHFVSDAAAS